MAVHVTAWLGWVPTVYIMWCYQYVYKFRGAVMEHLISDLCEAIMQLFIIITSLTITLLLCYCSYELFTFLFKMIGVL